MKAQGKMERELEIYMLGKAVEPSTVKGLICKRFIEQHTTSAPGSWELSAEESQSHSGSEV